MRHVVPWVVSWVVLWWFWLLLVGEWDHFEWIAASCAATVGATVGEVARREARVHARVPLRWLTRVWTAFGMVFVDFAVLVYALVQSATRREVARGAFRAHAFATGVDDPTSVGVRVWASVLATFSPNAYVVDIDPASQLVLLHDLVPYRRSEEPT